MKIVATTKEVEQAIQETWSGFERTSHSILDLADHVDTQFGSEILFCQATTMMELGL